MRKGNLFKHQPSAAGLFGGSPSAKLSRGSSYATGSLSARRLCHGSLGAAGLRRGPFGARIMESVVVFLSVFILTFCLSSTLVPVDSSSAADSSSGNLSMSYSAEQNLSISLDKTNVGINASSTDFGKMFTDNFNVTVSTNNVTGYTLNMATDSSATNGATITSGGSTQENVATNALVNTADNRYYLPSISAAIINPTDSTFPVNSWAYSISSTPTNMVYSPLPAAGSSAEIKKVTELTLEEDADGNLTADDVTPVTVATKADMSIPAGTYTNKLVFTAVTNFNPEYDSYTIIYDRNGTAGDGTSGTVGGDMIMVSHTGVHSGDAVMLYAPNYWRSGYGLLGWSSVANATKYVPSTQTSLNSGEAYVYGPNETITLSDADIAHANDTGVITMYAIWKASEGNMQSWTGCNVMSIGDVTALTDTRDGDTYAVAKLADGNCWTLENSRLSSGTIDSTTTNNPVSNFAWTESSNSWCETDSSDCNNQVLINTNNLNSSFTASPTANNNSSSWYSYGVSYDWYAATAGNGTYEFNTGGNNVSGDICPLGWHLPTSTDSGEYRAMYAAIGDTPANIRKYPNNFVLSGSWRGSSAPNRGLAGLYWSSTAYNSQYNGARYLNLDSSSVHPSYYDHKYAGRSVRCIANSKTIDGVDYIRLADGNWWTKNSQGSAIWANAASLCPSGTHLPSADEFTKLLTAYGGAAYSSYGSPYGWRDVDADLYNATGWSGLYWSSTEDASYTSDAWRLGAGSSYSTVSNGSKTYSYNVVCVKS